MSPRRAVAVSPHGGRKLTWSVEQGARLGAMGTGTCGGEERIGAEVLIVDDHPGYRAGLHAVLAHDAQITSVHEAGSVSEALELARTQKFELVIVDVLLPDTGGLALVRELARLQPATQVLVLSMIEEPIRIAEMLRAGAAGYAFKSQPVSGLMDAVHRVLEGHSYLPPLLPTDAFISGAPLPLERL